MPCIKFWHPILRVILFASSFWFSGCKTENATETAPHLKPTIVRFEQKLAQAAEKGPNQVAELRHHHAIIYRILVEEMLGIGPADSNITSEYLYQFQRDRYTDSLTNDVLKAFPKDRDPLLYQTLPNAIAQFKLTFESQTPKQITTFISGFRYQAAIDDSGDLLIGLDTYLGQKYRYYATAPYIYEYQTRRMSRDYLIADALRILLQDQIIPTKSTASLLEEMIASGKIHHAIKTLQPEIPDSALFRYTGHQAHWAAQHERAVWQYLVAQNLVYSSERRSKSRFLDDGPATLELDPNAPPRLGEWIGSAIVDLYMKKHPDMSLPDLFLKSGSDIFKESGYRGERS